MTDLPDCFHDDGFTVRRAAPEDIPVLVEMINRAFAYQDAAKGDVRVDEAAIRDKMAKNPFYLWYGRDDRPVACVYLKRLTTTLYFGLLSVTDGYRGTGLAPRIITAIEGYARAESFTKLRLDYMSLSPWLERYYERYGFTRSGIVRDIGWTSLIRMEKRLLPG